MHRGRMKLPMLKKGCFPHATAGVSSCGVVSVLTLTTVVVFSYRGGLGHTLPAGLSFLGMRSPKYIPRSPKYIPRRRRRGLL